MKRNLEARIERLEANSPEAIGRAHQIIQRAGETAESARKRYEHEARIEIDPEDLVILRRIVAAPAWRPA